ncbi:putative nuclease HARBI1 [Ylistrum balloti]|uniref:putative nuclease HARBI1 n=1 Tax=Ylistrum balloti TaxID=509963 RepID=UPI002905AEB8|nr:putative nuclease HARBI1 [Ylistrum balloti]
MDIPEQLKVKLDFYNIRGFPSVLGAVDGTLIPIETPSIDEYHYVCRNGFHALNIQGVCDANLKFLNIVAKWPGSTHDSFRWTNCGLSAAFEDKEMTGGWLLGDSGYGLRPWLLTPKLNPRTPLPYRKYNVCHKSTRCVIERAFGLWKMRFRCIYRPLHLATERAVAVVIATAILHNREKSPFARDRRHG